MLYKGKIKEDDMQFVEMDPPSCLIGGLELYVPLDLCLAATGFGEIAKRAKVSDGGGLDQHSVRAAFARRYVGHDAGHKCVLILKKGWLVTYAHGSHKDWKVGQKIQVFLNNEMGDQRRGVEATVAFKSDVEFGDYVLLRVKDDELPASATPVLDAELYQGAQYVLVGASAGSAEKDPSSVRHGVILSTRPDRNLHIKGDTPPVEDDSGGGCFLVTTGALIGMCVARDGQHTSFLPITVLLHKIGELEPQASAVAPDATLAEPE